jgi:hypothetical protein
MSLAEWSKAELEYGLRVLDSGLEGAHSGEEAYLNGKPFTPSFSDSVRKAVKPAALGALLGVLTSCPGNRQRSVSRTMAFGLVGGAIGFVASLLWENRRLTASVASGALKNIAKVRDEHWLEKHPIDYA